MKVVDSIVGFGMVGVNRQCRGLARSERSAQTRAELLGSPPS